MKLNSVDDLRKLFFKVVDITTDFGSKKVFLHSSMILSLNGVIDTDELLRQIFKQIGEDDGD